YFVQAATHCAACHSPRGPLGAIDPSRRFTGVKDGPDGMSAPNITPAKEAGIGTWSEKMLSFYLAIGMDPSGDFAGGAMADVIDQGTRHLTQADRHAIARYILSLPVESNTE